MWLAVGVPGQVGFDVEVACGVKPFPCTEMLKGLVTSGRPRVGAVYLAALRVLKEGLAMFLWAFFQDTLEPASCRSAGRARASWLRAACAASECRQQTAELQLSEPAGSFSRSVARAAPMSRVSVSPRGRQRPPSPSKPRGWRLAARPAVVTAAASGPGAHGSKGQRAKCDRRETGKNPAALGLGGGEAHRVLRMRTGLPPHVSSPDFQLYFAFAHV